VKTIAAFVLTIMLAAHPGVAAELKIGLSISPTSVDSQFYVVGPNSALARNILDGLFNQDEFVAAPVSSMDTKRSRSI